MRGEKRVVTALLLVVIASARAGAVMNASTECLIRFEGLGDSVKNGGTLHCKDCDPRCDADPAGTPNGSCTFKLRACVNDADADCTGTELKKMTVKGKCGASALGFAPVGTALACGPDASLSVALRKHGRKSGMCKVKAKTLSSGKPRRVDQDVLTLVCDPRPSSESCETTSTTTTTMPCALPATGTTSQCAPIVLGQPIPNSYRLMGTTGEKRCVTIAAANRFGTCSTDADCGGTAGACLALPWVTADGTLMPFPTGSQVTFTVNDAGTFPACEHSLCIPCGNPNAPCAGIPGCEVPGNPCITRGTQGCCDQPGFIVPTFFVNLLGGLCSRVDQISCGVGVINTSNPQTGDNEVDKVADTSDPGPDCTYGTADDPAPVACSTAGSDANGRIARTIGNGSADASGIQYRLTTPQISTTWIDMQSPAGICADGSKFDDGETLVSQLLLKSEPTTAGASGGYGDQNGDACSRTGFGFGGTNPDGPIVVAPAPAGPLRPQPYDGSSGSVAAAVSEVFTGSGTPLKDIGFVAITPYLPAEVVPALACCCSASAGCPE
jgi:hypothetical protein